VGQGVAAVSIAGGVIDAVEQGEQEVRRPGEIDVILPISLTLDLSISCRHSGTSHVELPGSHSRLPEAAERIRQSWPGVGPSALTSLR
jgi:hypothetical protein